MNTKAWEICSSNVFEPNFFFLETRGKRTSFKKYCSEIFAYDKYIKLNNFIDVARKIMQFGKYIKINKNIVFNQL